MRSLCPLPLRCDLSLFTLYLYFQHPVSITQVQTRWPPLPLQRVHRTRARLATTTSHHLTSVDLVASKKLKPVTGTVLSPTTVHLLHLQYQHQLVRCPLEVRSNPLLHDSVVRPNLAALESTADI